MKLRNLHKRIIGTVDYAIRYAAHWFRCKTSKRAPRDEAMLSKKVSHQNWQHFLYAEGNKPGLRILEIGSREVTAPSMARRGFANATYVGFDFYPGTNVDVVGDVHKLSSYFRGQEKFDIIYSAACFEHFAMPWVAAVEMAKMLKVGGLLFVESHFAFQCHERPWHFFHFTDMGLRALFSPALGFECIEAGFSNPITGRFTMEADPYLKNGKLKGLYCHTEYLGRKVRDVKDFHWEHLNLDEVVGDTKYPAPEPSAPFAASGRR